MESFLFQATIYLGTAVVAVPIASRLGLGSVLGYLVAGILIGPAVLGLIGNEALEVQHFAEFGVVMLLFIIGLELEPRTLWDMRHRLVGMGGLQVLVTMALIALAARLMGQPWNVAIAIGMILSLSSTAIILQTLSEKGLMQSAGGRAAFATLLTQDIAVIPMLALLPLLSFVPALSADAHGASNGITEWIAHLPGWGVTLVTLGAIATIALAGIFLVRPLFAFIATARLREMNTALALLIVVGISSLMTLVGLSPALGAFLAGVVLANSEFRHELQSDIEPFKGLLLGLFFITVGAGINFGKFAENLGLVVALTLALMFLKGVVLFIIARAFKLRKRGLWLYTLSLAQAGEFGFVLISFSRQQNVLPTNLSELLLLVIAMSMLLTPLAFIIFGIVSRRAVDGADLGEAHDEVDEQQPVIIAGMGRFGEAVNRLVQSAGFKTVVLDHDLKVINLVRAFGTKAFFGDPTRPEVLSAAGLDEAKVLVVAIDDNEASIRMVKYVRARRPDLPIIVRASDRNHVYALYQAGATHIVRELFDSSLRAGRYVLEHMGLTEFEAHDSEQMFYQMDRRAMSELAPLWDASVPVAKNRAYIERARALDKELENALLGITIGKDSAEFQPPETPASAKVAMPE